jgi:hypothetical protein
MSEFGWNVIAIPPLHEVAAHYDAVAERALDPWPHAADEVFDYLENMEQRAFQRLRGRYVLTGETELSLTRRHAPGSIRHFVGESCFFGSNVDKAGWLTKRPRDPDLGQVPKRHRPDLRSAVLFNPPEAGQTIAQIMADQIVEPF